MARLLWWLLRPYRYRILGLSVLISGTAALGAAGPQFVRVAFDTVIPRGELRVFGLFAAAFALFYLVRSGLGYAGMYLSFSFTQRVISDIRARAYGRLLRLPIVRFEAEQSGSLTSRVVNDVNALEGMIQAGATRLAGQLFSILVVGGLLIWMNWRLALVNLVVLPALALVTRHFQRPLRLQAREIRREVGGMAAVATEAIGNIQVVKSFVAEVEEEARFGARNDRYVRLNLERRKDVGIMEALITLVSNFGIGALLLLGGWMVVRGSLTLGELTAFVLYQQQLQQPVMSVMFFNNQLQAGLAALERVSDLLEADPEPQGGSGEPPAGDLAFEGVTFTYPGTTDPALRDLTLRFHQGQTAALVGSSGSGKTTLTRLIVRLYDPQRGSVRIGGRDVRDLSLAALRRSIAVVPQEPTLFSGSVQENIGYADPGAGPERIRRAAELANADAFIRALPQGYDTPLGERGVRLSGGQKQRIAIARAILKEARYLVLDEATSALDSESEAVIQDALDGLFARGSGLTSIVIAHRLSTIEGADVIHVLEEGRLVESGTHASLLARGGRYAVLYEVQYGEDARGVASLRSTGTPGLP
ncbi:MAG: ABC transporter ATP-binding protein [Longimicrobiales bacterium]|nr:ABC transporter ATP-binding protein [Longimicrobiales bacterium]